MHHMAGRMFMCIRGMRPSEGRESLNAGAVRNSWIMTILLFVLGVVPAHAAPLAVIPGTEPSVTFLDQCIRDTHLEAYLLATRTCPAPLTWDRETGAPGSGPAFQPVTAGIVHLPEGDRHVLREAGGSMGSALPLLIAGCLFIGMSNFIRFCTGNREQRVSAQSRADDSAVPERVLPA